MSYELILKPKAKQDIVDATCFYSALNSHLGDDFLLAIGEGFERIQSSPELFAKRFREIRQLRLRRFPYVVSYILEEKRIYVLAVIHGHRSPKIWQSRSDK